MAIFPDLGESYLSETDRSMKSRMESFYTESITINQSFWGEADLDTRFESGDQNVWMDIYGNLPANRRRQFNFNRIRRVINMVSGHQRKNRNSTIVTPIENGDELTADQFTKILMWLNSQEGVLETISESFHGALVTGMNLLQVWVDYRNDPISGNVKVDNCSYNSFLIDPYFKKADLSDCNGIWRRSYLTKQGIMSLLPSYADDISGLPTNNKQDGKFQFMPENYNYGMKNLMTYDEFYYRDFRKQKMLVDTQTGETFEWKTDNDDDLKQFLNLYRQITVLDQEIPTVNLAIVVQGKVFYDGANPLGVDVYPFIPVLGYYNPQMPYFPDRIQGMVRGLRDAQYLYNRRKGIELDILESQINSGFKYKENALVNPKDVFMSGQGRGLALKETALMTDVEQIIAPQVPPSMLQLSEVLGREIQEISGVNEELLGSALDDKAGILSMLRQGAGLTTLQGLFDQLDYSQKLLGRLMIKIVQNSFTPGKVKRILNEEPAPQFYNKAFGTYDCAIEEGFNTSTQRQLQFAQLLHLKEVGVPVPDTALIEAATVQDKRKLTEALEKQAQQAQEMQQMQLQSQLQEAQARTELAKARAVADEGLGYERMSRIEENKQLAVERRSQAIENISDARENRASSQQKRAAAVLDIVRALKEMDTIDLANLEKLISISQTLSGQAGPEPTSQTPTGVEQ